MNSKEHTLKKSGSADMLVHIHGLSTWNSTHYIDDVTISSLKYKLPLDLCIRLCNRYHFDHAINNNIYLQHKCNTNIPEVLTYRSFLIHVLSMQYILFSPVTSLTGVLVALIILA